MSGRWQVAAIVLMVLGTACGTADSADNVAVLDEILVRHPHRAEITIDGATDAFGVQCTLSSNSVRVVASSTEAVFNMSGTRDGSEISISGFSSHLRDGFAASGAVVESLDLSTDVLSGRVEGGPGDGYEQLSFRVDCRN